MPLKKEFTHVHLPENGSQKENARLTVLEENDVNTIYNQLFMWRMSEGEDKDRENKNMAQ